MRETAYRFGKDGHLVGVISEPEFNRRAQNLPAVLLLTAGLLHRVGPYRLYVNIARRLAALGFAVLRFDLGGVGDSDSPRGSGTFESRSVDEIREAMDFLSVCKGAREFVLIGLCSGADDAHRVAVADPRVTGAVLLDGYSYKTWRYYLAHYAIRFFSLRKWRSFLQSKWSRVLSTGHATEIQADLNFRHTPAKEAVSKDLQAMIGRGVHFLYIYAGGSGSYSYRGQLRDAFRALDFRDQMQVEYFGRADHMYILSEDRARVQSTICNWMKHQYCINAQPTLETERKAG